MAIEANVETIIDRNMAVYETSHRLGQTLRKFIEVRGRLQEIGQPMTSAQKQAAVQAAQQAVTDLGAAVSSLQTAWTANSPL